MHEIEKILRKHFTPDELEFMALNKEIDDWQWLSDHGYAILVKDKEKLFGRHYEYTEEGEKYSEKREKRMKLLFNRIDFDSNRKKCRLAESEIENYCRKHNDYDDKKLSDDMRHFLNEVIYVW